MQEILQSPSTLGPTAFLRGLIQGMRCGILAVDREGRLLMLNEPARQVLELGREAQCGEPVERVLHDHPQLAQILLESFSMQSLPNRAEIDLRCRSEKGKTIGFTLSHVVDENGEASGAAIFFKDLAKARGTPLEEDLPPGEAVTGEGLE